MPARFCYFTYPLRNSILTPQNAITNVDASQNGSLRAALYGAGQPPRWINLTNYPNNDASFAVLMGGQTPELQAALNQDMAAGIEGFWSTADEIHVWYMRRKTGGPIVKHTETVALVMPCFAFLRPTLFAGAYTTDPSQIGP